MAGRGWFQAIDASDVARLMALPEPERWLFAEPDVGVATARFHLYMDKAWVPIHRALSDGTLHGLLGEPPLCSAVLGDHLVCRTVSDDFVYLKRVVEVTEIAVALGELTRGAVEEKFDAMHEDAEDATAFALDAVGKNLEYAWPYFEGMREFYRRAASAGLAVLFNWG